MGMLVAAADELPFRLPYLDGLAPLRRIFSVFQLRSLQSS